MESQESNPESQAGHEGGRETSGAAQPENRLAKLQDISKRMWPNGAPDRRDEL